MIKLQYLHSNETDANFRYIVALMIEARFRGYPLLVISIINLSKAGKFSDYINKIIDWLIEKFPDEFQKE